jgi:hypothetical protein
VLLSTLGEEATASRANSCGTPTTASKLQMPLQLFGAKVIIIDGNLPASLQQQLSRFCSRRLASFASPAAQPIAGLHFFVERMMRFTTETDTPKVRAMVGAFRPASNDARIRFAFPSGISRGWLDSIRGDTGRDVRGAEVSLVLPVEVPRFRVAISASTAACSR